MYTTVKELLDALYKKGKRKGLVVISQRDTIADAARMMKRRKINLLVVTGKNPIGIITTSDVSSAAGLNYQYDKLFKHVTTDVKTVKLTDKVDIVAEMLPAEGIRHIIVVDDHGKWVAVLTSNEVLKAVNENLHELQKFAEFSEHRT